MATSEPRGKAAVLPDDVLREAGLKPRKDWSEKHWLAFLAGWMQQRLGIKPSPEARSPAPEYCDLGFREAKHFEPAAVAA